MKLIIERLRRTLAPASVRGAVFTLAVAAVAVLALPAAAHADGTYYWQCGESYIVCTTGDNAGLVEGDCMTASAAFQSTQVCVDYSGDRVFVYDGKADGWAAMARIVVDEGSVYTRYCRNNLGYGKWAVCDFNWAEAGNHQASGGYKISSTVMEFDWLWNWYDK